MTRRVFVTAVDGELMHVGPLGRNLGHVLDAHAIGRHHVSSFRYADRVYRVIHQTLEFSTNSARQQPTARHRLMFARQQHSLKSISASMNLLCGAVERRF